MIPARIRGSFSQAHRPNPKYQPEAAMQQVDVPHRRAEALQRLEPSNCEQGQAADKMLAGKQGVPTRSTIT